MKERKNRWIVDCLIILAMMVTVFVLCHPIGRNWTEEEVERYIGTEGEYSPDVDSYYYLRKAKEFSEGGIKSVRLISYRVEDAKCTSGEVIAKEANGAMPQLLPASAAYVWYGLRAVGIDVSIYVVAMRFCSILLSLFVVPVYLFLRRRTSRTAAVLGSFLVTLEVPFFRHSHVGFFDTDALIGLLSLILVLSLFECATREKRIEQVICGMVSFASLILLRYTWTAFFIYGIIAGGTTLMGVIGVRMYGKFNEKRKNEYMIPVAFGLAIIVSSFVLGWTSFVSLAKGFVTSLAGNNDWPSETLNITELRKVPFFDSKNLGNFFLGVRSDVTSLTGGVLALLLLVISVVISIVQIIQLIRRRSSDEAGRMFVLSALLTWVIGAALLAWFGTRYMEFLTLPASIITGLQFDCIAGFCKGRTLNERRILYVVIGLFAFGGLVLFIPIISIVVAAAVITLGWFLSRSARDGVLVILLATTVILPIGISCVIICAEEKPYIESSVEEAMIWVKENTNPESVLLDFWNLGYIYQYYGERKTVADGGTYNGQFFYWLANMLTTDNPQLSVGIAKMLQNCGIDGSEYATKVMGNAQDARRLLKSILSLSREKAETVLREEYAFSEGEISRLLDFTHPTRYPDLYYVTSHNTFEVISSLEIIYRNWETGNSEAQEGTFYSTGAVLRPRNGETIHSEMVFGGEDSVGAMVAISSLGEELTGQIVTPEGERMDCGRVLYIRNGIVVYDRVNESSESKNQALNEALMLFEEDGMVSAVLLERNVVDSTFVKLYLRNGEGQSLFEKVYDSVGRNRIQERLDDNSSIVIWKVTTE